MAEQAQKMKNINPLSLLDCRDPDYQPPTADDVRALVEFAKAEYGASLKDVGAVVNTTYQHVQSWRDGKWEINYCTWRVLLWEFDLINTQAVSKNR